MSRRRNTPLSSTWSSGQVVLVGSLAGVVLVPVLRQFQRLLRQHVPGSSTFVSETPLAQLAPHLLAGTSLSNKIPVHGWAILPAEIFEIVLSLMSPMTCWTAREVSSAWTDQARQMACFEIKIMANRFNLVSRVAVRALYKQQLRHQLPNIPVAFHLPQPVNLKQISCLLQELNAKVLSSHLCWHLVCSHLKQTEACCLVQTDCLLPCRLNLALRMSRGSNQHLSHRHEVQFFAARLAKHGVMVNITLKPVKGMAQYSADSALFWPIAPLLAGIDMYSIPAQQTTTDWHVYKAATSNFRHSCVEDLRHCSAELSTLCIAQEWSPFPVAGTLVSIAQLQGLTKLHLTFSNSTQATDFQPLSTLSKLEDLALQCACHSAACSSVLDSCRLTLHQVILASESWTWDTYSALQQILGLETVLLKIRALSAPEADTRVGITATLMHLDLHCDGDVLSDSLFALSTARPAAQVHALTLRNADHFSCQHLGSLPILESLTYINSPGLTGRLLSAQPKLTELRLINCSGINVAGLQHMLSVALPALKVLAFQAADSPGVDRQLRLDVDALQMLPCGNNLASIDMRGIDGLTKDDVEALKLAFIKTDGRAQSSVTVHLPLHDLGQCQPFGQVHSSLFAPPFHVKLSEQGSRRLICKR